MTTDQPTVLHPAARVLWRARDQIQLELGDRGIVVAGVSSDDVRRLVGRAQAPPADQRELPFPPHRLRAARERLLADGFLWPAPEPTTGDWVEDWTADWRRRPPEPRLATELAALTATVGEHAAAVLGARRHCSVDVMGTGRAGPQVAALLAAAGVGRVRVAESVPTRLRHTLPGGVTPADEGATLSAAAERAVHRAAPGADCTPLPFGEPPDLVVLACDEPPDTEQRDLLHARDCPHLIVQLAGSYGTVGPLVLPGLTSCLRCADLHRLDRDPAWLALAAQLSVPHRASGAGEVALAATIGGLAAQQALDFLDGGETAAVEGTLEIHRPDYRVRRRSWPPHPDCACMANADQEE